MQPPARTTIRKTLIVWTAIGSGVGYLVLSPFAMVFFHLAHSGLDPQMVMGMHHSIWMSIGDAFSPHIWVWGTSFGLLGVGLGLVVGVVLSKSRAQTRRIAEHAQTLDEANRKLDEAYRQVLQADKLASLGLLASTVVHDVNNHLQVIHLVSELELSERQPTADDPWMEVRGAVCRMRRLTESIRVFSRKSNGGRVPVDVHDVLHDTLVILRRTIDRKGVTLSQAFHAADGRIQGSSNELLQVFLNLTQNALDATPVGGRLTIATDVSEGTLEVSVADTGCGIPLALRERIFEAFFTTKPTERGTGLGLSICQRIVAEHGGSIALASEVGVGTTFTVRLPLLADVSREPERMDLGLIPAS